MVPVYSTVESVFSFVMKLHFLNLFPYIVRSNGFSPECFRELVEAVLQTKSLSEYNVRSNGLSTVCVQRLYVFVKVAGHTKSLTAHSALKWFHTSVCSHVFDYFDHVNITM